MDVTKLRQVVAIRRLGSFAKAAEVLGLSQPSLSRSIAQLEAELNVRLFERSSTGAAATPVGELLADRAVAVIVEAETLARDTALIGGGETGVVRIGVSTALRDGFLPELTRRVTGQHPNLGLHIEVGSRAALSEAVVSRELDLVLALYTRGMETPGLATTRIMGVEIVAVVAPEHPLAGERGVSAERFTQFRSAGPPSPLMYDIYGLPRSEHLEFYSSNDLSGILTFVTAGLATAIMPSLVVQPLIDQGRLARVDMAQVDVDFLAVTSRAAAGSPILRRIIDHTRAVANELLPEATGAATSRDSGGA
jgi:DNA-binding transcriptional LysR family regulator